jgi:hypothetical protein
MHISYSSPIMKSLERTLNINKVVFR